MKRKPKLKGWKRYSPKIFWVACTTCRMEFRREPGLKNYEGIYNWIYCESCAKEFTAVYKEIYPGVSDDN